jgi:hypothetical protein
MFLYFSIAHFLFTSNFNVTAIHSFDWMTWITPKKFNLAMVTGLLGQTGHYPFGNL